MFDLIHVVSGNYPKLPWKQIDGRYTVDSNGIRLSIFPGIDGWSWKAEKDENIIKVGSYHIIVDIAQFCAEQWMVENA